MAKIIKVTDINVKIAKDDGTYLDVERTSLNFLPEVGQKVEVYEIDDEVIVNQVKENIQDKININIDNTSVNTNTNVQNQGNTTYVTGRPVKKWIYVLLALFLGGLGAHHFYAGYTSKGWIYLLFCWTYIPAILAAFKGISAAFQASDSNGYIIV